MLFSRSYSRFHDGLRGGGGRRQLATVGIRIESMVSDFGYIRSLLELGATASRGYFATELPPASW